MDRIGNLAHDGQILRKQTVLPPKKKTESKNTILIESNTALIQSTERTFNKVFLFASRLRGINILQRIISFCPYRQSLCDICTKLDHGKLFADMLARHTTIYGVRLITFIRISEQTGRLFPMLCQQVDHLSTHLEYSIKQLGQYMMLLFLLRNMPLVVIFISMYIPILKFRSAFI